MPDYTPDLHRNLAKFISRGTQLTQSAAAVYRALNNLDPTTIDQATRAQITAVCTAWLAATNAPRHEVRLKDWDTRAPTYDRSMGGYTGRFIDHPYKLLEDGRSTYYSEPYELTGDGIRDLARLDTAGWSVSITGESLHYPGRCVRIELTPPK